MTAAQAPGGRSTRGLPPLATSFLGRADERRELAGPLEDTRLVTLTGAPGIGKSRLAIELARQLAGSYRDGAHLAELAPITDPAIIPAALAAAVSITEVPGQSLAATLVESLRRRSSLIVLDNCEHLLEACAELVGTLVEFCPEIAILATSRQPLGIDGEAVHRCSEPAWRPPAGRSRTPARRTSCRRTIRAARSSRIRARSRICSTTRTSRAVCFARDPRRRQPAGRRDDDLRT